MFGFDSRRQAEEAWNLARRLSRRGAIQLVDGALAWREPDGAVRILGACGAPGPPRSGERSPAVTEELRRHRPIVIKTTLDRRREDELVRALRSEPAVGSTAGSAADSASVAG